MTGDLRFLIAEDEPLVQELITHALSDLQYSDIHVANNGQEAFEMVSTLEPDVLITDLMMPKMGGIELSERALESQPDLTVVVTTGNGTVENAVQTLKLGVFDFVTKPIDLDTFQSSVQRAAARARDRIELNGIRDVIDALMAALESKDPYLLGHGKRVSIMTRRLAEYAGWTKQKVRLLEYAALVHDVGKIGIPESILNKPGPLTDDEMELIKRHPIYSHDIIQPVPFLKEALPYVLHHHERIDGKGYPHGLAGDEIPEGARIISVCDTYDAMNSVRSYRPGVPEEKILVVLEEEKGKQLDAYLVDLFLDNLESIKVGPHSMEPKKLACV